MKVFQAQAPQTKNVAMDTIPGIVEFRVGNNVDTLYIKLTGGKVGISEQTTNAQKR